MPRRRQGTKHNKRSAGMASYCFKLQFNVALQLGALRIAPSNCMQTIASVQSTSNGHPEDFKNEMDETKHKNTTMAVQYHRPSLL